MNTAIRRCRICDAEMFERQIATHDGMIRFYRCQCGFIEPIQSLQSAATPDLTRPRPGDRQESPGNQIQGVRA